MPEPIVQTPEIRSSGIGGSDAGIILGLNHYKTPVELYYEKRGEKDSFHGNEATHFGNVLEDVVAREYMTRTYCRVSRWNKSVRHPEHQWMMGHIDRRVLGIAGGKGLECKTSLTKFWRPSEWGDDGTDEVPMSYLAQCQHYMAVTGWKYWDLAVLLAGPEFRVYHIPRNEEFIDLMIQQEADFWDCVVNEHPPKPIKFSDTQLIWQAGAGDSMVASVEMEKYVDTLSDIHRQQKELDAQEDTIKMHIAEAMTEHTYLLNQQGDKILTFKEKNTTRLNTKQLKAESPEIYDQYAHTTTSRVMRLCEKQGA